MGQPARSRRRIVADSSDAEEPSSQTSRSKTSRQPERKTNSRVGSRTKPNAASSSETPAGDGSVSNSNDTKTASRPIYSFFNAATQRQITPVNSTFVDTSVREPEPEETILDFSDDQDPQEDLLSKKPGAGPPLRKRSRALTDESRKDSWGGSQASSKFRKTSNPTQLPLPLRRTEDRRPWTDQFPPHDLNELAVHKRKVGDVRQWLETAFGGRRHKILVLKGPAGAGKTTTVHLLARDLNFNILEWRNPVGGDLAADHTVSAAAQFDEFLFRSGRGRGLAIDTSTANVNTSAVASSTKSHEQAGKQVILIEEFPNTYSKSSPLLQAFRTTLLQYLSLSPIESGQVVPIVMVISETLLSTSTAVADSFTAHRLLGPDLLVNSFLNTIEFNPVAPTILLKALQLTVIKEARKSGRRYAPGLPILKRLAESGDVRSAISSLEFLCLRGDGENIWSGKIAFTKPKKSAIDAPLTQIEMDAMDLISSRETSLSIFHAVGRVVYNNRTDPLPGDSVPQPPAWMPHHYRRKVPEKSPDALIDEVGTDPSTFVAALHENHLPSCWTGELSHDLEVSEGCAEDFSDADLLSMDRYIFANRTIAPVNSDGLRQDEISFHVAVRGLLFHLPHPVHRSNSTHGRRGDAFRMFYPKSLRLWKKAEENESTVSMLIRRAQEGTILPEITLSKRTVLHPNAHPSRDQCASQDELRIPASVSTKDEMLLERLPYMSHIITAMPLTFRQAQTLEQIQTVTKIAGAMPTEEDADDASAEDESQPVFAEPWSTDGPVVESTIDSALSPAKHKIRGRMALETEGDGLLIPVEHSVEKLILEEDDIED